MKIVEALDAQKSKEKIDENKQHIVTEFHDRLHDVWQYYQLESSDDIIAPIQLVTPQNLWPGLNPEDLDRLDEVEVTSPFRDLLKENGLDLFKVGHLRWVVADLRPMSRIIFTEVLTTFLIGALFFVGLGMWQSSRPILGAAVIAAILVALIIVLRKRTSCQVEHNEVTSGGLTYSEMKERLGQFTAQVDVVNIDN